MLKVLLILAAVIGMAIPAMANPKNEPISVASNTKDIFVQVDGANVANNGIAQVLNNYGDQTNFAQGIAVAGDATANSANVGYANSGATSAAANFLDAMGDSSAYSQDNEANNDQFSKADADAGDAYGFKDDVKQENEVKQDAWALIKNDQDLNQFVQIDEYQDAHTFTKSDQEIKDSLFDENNWTSITNKTI